MNSITCSLNMPGGIVGLLVTDSLEFGSFVAAIKPCEFSSLGGDIEEVASSLLLDENTVVYEACADFQEKSSLLILLRNGKKIWPVHVVHNQFGDGWADFWDSHKLRRGFKLVFGCERTWIFDVVVLMTNLEPLYYHWSTTAHEFQESSLMPFVIDDLGTPGHLRTSCLLSTMSTKDNIMQFGYDCGSGKCIFREFGKRFRDYFRDAGDYDIFLHMRNRWWAVSIINNRVDRPGLAHFFKALNLQPLDFLLVTAFDGGDVNVIVFTGDGIERVYPWT
ncbi:hypothetical protein RHSIM_Rhsim12G0075400 [Rhododendron simsii]|uniref:Uncharacterized protein n=1 Tax=Rhododendron simsii TaxID=118357 RepID=A0A834G362_RHOSS|nr:hypothetical protein RHSIM_Rhsim12G0075400 [Rhododendron simsii]